MECAGNAIVPQSLLKRFCSFLIPGEVNRVIQRFETEARHAMCIQNKNKEGKGKYTRMAPVRRATSSFRLRTLRGIETVSYALLLCLL